MNPCLEGKRCVQKLDLQTPLQFVHHRWKAGEWVRMSPLTPTEGATVNANGAGDAFCAGFLAAMLSYEPTTLREATTIAMASALQRIDTSVTPRAFESLLTGARAETAQELQRRAATSPEQSSNSWYAK